MGILVKRGIAFLIDAAIAIIIGVAAAVYLEVDVTSPDGDMMFKMLCIGAYFVYSVFMTVLPMQATIGKYFLGLSVTGSNEYKASIFRIIPRELFKAVMLVLLFHFTVLGLILWAITCIYCMSNDAMLYDKITGTKVE